MQWLGFVSQDSIRGNTTIGMCSQQVATSPEFETALRVLMMAGVLKQNEAQLELAGVGGASMSTWSASVLLLTALDPPDAPVT